MSLTVSIAIPFFNEDQRIRTLLDAIFAQTRPSNPSLLTITDLWLIFGWLLTFELLASFGILGLAGFHVTIHPHEIFHLVGWPLAVSVGHLNRGGGFLWSILAGMQKV